MTSITTSLKKIHVELLFTDTRSITYEIKWEDVFEEFFKHKNLFEFSKSPNHSKFFDPTNKKVISKMKDVSEGKINYEFVGLNSKMYSIKHIDGKEPYTAKGVNIATELKEFKVTLLKKKIMKRIQSKKHKVGTYEINKISLSNFDDKRFFLDVEIHLLAYFHKDIDPHKW